jgi:hypothetical protein
MRRKTPALDAGMEHRGRWEAGEAWAGRPRALPLFATPLNRNFTVWRSYSLILLPNPVTTAAI